jgi:3-oxoacyl-[acyl-carrier-protein] synthase II
MSGQAVGDRAVVTGIGMVTPLGDDPEAVWQRVLAGESAARAWEDLAAAGFPIIRACRIAGDLGEPDPSRRGRALAARAVAYALADAGLGASATTGLFAGTTMGESAAYEAAAEGVPTDLAAVAGHSIVADVAEQLGLTGPQRTYSTACAAGNYAIGAAAQMVERGLADVVVAGGVEPFSRIALLGFARMRAMSPDFCRPFDAGRRGMQLGEAAAFVVVERESGARARGAGVLAVVGSLGLAGDAHHPTAPLPDGSGMAAAMASALDRTGVASSAVGWLNAHGTGTPQSDAAEALAIATVFGPDGPPVSSLKGAFGHSLGAATAVEAVLSILALGHQIVPPTANVLMRDASLAIDLVAEPRPADLEWVLNCGYGFGGVNSALLLGAP